MTSKKIVPAAALDRRRQCKGVVLLVEIAGSCARALWHGRAAKQADAEGISMIERPWILSPSADREFYPLPLYFITTMAPIMRVHMRKLTKAACIDAQSNLLYTRAIFQGFWWRSADSNRAMLGL